MVLTGTEFPCREDPDSEQNPLEDVRLPFDITSDQERRLRIDADHLVPSLVISQATSFDQYVRQLTIPRTVMDLARKASGIRLSAWELEAIGAQLEPRGGGVLRRILEAKVENDDSHPPYIRVACAGRGDYDDLIGESGHPGIAVPHKHESAGSPVVLEIWPAQHYSPIHSHGGTTGIIHCLAGRIDVMVYEKLAWTSRKLGLVTLQPGQCAWLAGDQFAVHRVHCPMDGGRTRVGPGNPLNESSDYAATFHVYLNEDEAMPGHRTGAPRGSREVFSTIDERTHAVRDVITFSDLSWSVLREVLAEQR